MSLSELKVTRSALTKALIAGMIMAVVSVPGAIANGLLAGVNPIYGVYSMIAGTTVAAFFTSSVVMNVDSTSATALATFEALDGLAPEEKLASLVVLSLLVGAFMLAFGLLKLGFLVRFISNAVMTGFLSGLGVLTILGQLADITGYVSDQGNKVTRAADTLVNWQEVDWRTLFVGVLTIVVIVALTRTKLEKFGFLIGVVFTTVLVAIFSPASVAIVGDDTQIPRELPAFNVPDLSLIGGLLLPAAAIAIIALVQAAGVSSSVPNPDGEYPDPSGDFRGQGIANGAVGVFGGVPVGGSLSGTILIQNLGGRNRWANIATGVFALAAILLIGPLIERIPMPTLAGLLMVIGFSMINRDRIVTVWHTSRASSTVMVVTFTATLFFPIQIAVAAGVLIHLVVHVFRSAEAVRVERIEHGPEGGYLETDAPTDVPSGEVLILQPIGSLFFAGVAELAEKLPSVGSASGSVVILRLRDRDEVGSTFVRAIERYAQELLDGGNLLILEGINERVHEQLERTELLELIGEDNVFVGQPGFGVALGRAERAATEWMEQE